MEGLSSAHVPWRARCCLGRDALISAFNLHSPLTHALTSLRGIASLRNSADPGIIPRSVEALLRMVTAEKTVGTFNHHRLTMSYLELYNEKIFDLLEPKDKDLYVGRGPPSTRR